MAETGTPHGGEAWILDPELFVPAHGVIALPAIILGRWNPVGALFACLLFGLAGKPRPAGAVGLPYRREIK